MNMNKMQEKSENLKIPLRLVITSLIGICFFALKSIAFQNNSYMSYNQLPKMVLLNWRVYCLVFVSFCLNLRNVRFLWRSRVGCQY